MMLQVKASYIGQTLTGVSWYDRDNQLQGIDYAELQARGICNREDFKDFMAAISAEDTI